MANTFLDQLVEYPAKILKRIAEDKYCVGFLANKDFDSVNEDDMDEVLENNIFDYQYVDSTTQEAGSYIWVEVDIPRVENAQIKDVRVYVVIACHKQWMGLDRSKFPGIVGNRRDNLVRYVDRLLNNSGAFGIGKLKLESVKPLSTINGFAMSELAYTIPDFNIVGLEK